jgi:hypothetical protein
MLNPDVFHRDTSIYAIIFVPRNAFKGNNSKKPVESRHFSKSQLGKSSLY